MACAKSGNKRVTLQFGVLGPIEVRSEGALIRLGGARQRALLAILLLHSNRVLSSERLVDLLWEDEAPESASNALQVHVSQLRRALSTQADVVQTRPSGYVLAIDPDQCDIHRFEALAQSGRRALNNGDAGQAAEHIRSALNLWRGDALADFEHALFAVGARTRLEELRLTALEDRIQADLNLGRHLELVGELQALVTEHPLRERLCGELMLTLYRSGRQAEATQAFQRTRQRLVEALGLEPGPELQDLFTRILRQDSTLELQTASVRSSSPRAHNLPLQLTSFIGRQQDLAALPTILRGARLVTLLGPGGIGKTRLALRLAGEMRDAYADGVFLVDFASVEAPEAVPRRALAALNIEQQGASSPVDAIARRVRNQQLLLVMDNCEHVVAGVADLVLELLTQCPKLSVLTTSRERLGLAGEQVWRVNPLELPPESASRSAVALMTYESIQLFVDRAQAAERSFELNESNAPAVTELCRSLDGLPLALELAAASASVATARDMLVNLEHRTSLPVRAARGVHRRQTSLEAALDWSYVLLNAAEQALMRRLSVFAGDFSLRAAEQVCADELLPRSQVLPVLCAVTDKSLVAMHEASDGAARYRLLNTVRQYACSRLAETAEADDLVQRHARYILWLASASADALHSPDAAAWMRHMEELHADLLAALGWTKHADPELCLRLAIASGPFWEDRAYLSEGRMWLQTAIEIASHAPPGVTAAALFADGRLAVLQNDFPSAREQLAHGLAECAGSTERSLQSGLLRLLGLVATLMGEHEAGGAWLRQSLQIAEDLADDEAIGHALHTLAQSLRVSGNDAAAEHHHARCLSVARAVHNRRLEALALINLGTLALRRGDIPLAADRLRDSLEIWSWLGARLEAAAAVAALGYVADAQGDSTRGLRLVSAATAFGKAVGASVSRTAVFWFGDDMSRRLETMRQQLDSEEAATVWEHGSQMRLEDAITDALSRTTELVLPARPVP